jgi:cation-transporting ATPase E
MGSGADATRAAAQLVLLDSNFSSLPPVVAEGRPVFAHIQRGANQLQNKNVFALLLALAVGVAGLPFPFLPRHLTLVGSLTIGIPAFFLALAPNTTRAEPNFVARVMRFAVPAGVLCASATFGGYYLANLNSSTLTLDQRRTTATLVLVGVGFLILIRLARPLNGWRRVLVGTLVGAFALVLVVPFGREFFALSMPSPLTTVAVVGIIAVSWWIMEIAEKIARAYRRPYERLQAAQERTSAREMDRRTQRNTAHTVKITGGIGHDPTRALPPQSAPTVPVDHAATPPFPTGDDPVPPTVVDDPRP